MKLTKKQQIALKRKYDQNPDGSRSFLSFRRRVQIGYDCIMINWCGMWLGIESDGYTHS